MCVCTSFPVVFHRLVKIACREAYCEQYTIDLDNLWHLSQSAERDQNTRSPVRLWCAFRDKKQQFCNERISCKDNAVVINCFVLNITPTVPFLQPLGFKLNLNQRGGSYILQAKLRLNYYILLKIHLKLRNWFVFQVSCSMTFGLVAKQSKSTSKLDLQSIVQNSLNLLIKHSDNAISINENIKINRKHDTNTSCFGNSGRDLY